MPSQLGENKMSKQFNRETISDYLTFAFIVLAAVSIFLGPEIKNAYASTAVPTSSATLQIATVSGAAGSLANLR